MMLCVPIMPPPLSQGSVPTSRVRSPLGKGREASGRYGTTIWLSRPCNPQEERAAPQRYKKGGSVGGVCYLSMGMVVLLMGLVFASVYIYRYFFLAQVRPFGEGGTALRERCCLEGLAGRWQERLRARCLGLVRGGAAGDLPPGGSGCPAKPRNPACSLHGASLGMRQPTRPLAWRGEQGPVF